MTKMMEYILKNKLDYALRYVLGCVLLFLSLWFIFQPESAESFKKFNQPDSVRQILGWTEAIVSLLFILYPTRFIGAAGLLAVFFYATYLHINAGLQAFGLIPWTIGILFVVYCEKQRKNHENYEA